MRKLFLFFLLILAPYTSIYGEEPGQAYQKGRAIIADLGRIVSPQGIQESYKVRVGGIDQWVYVRGQNRANPIILFIHGGPAAPMSPNAWQFQRPIEEYFTVVHYDQRGAGKTFLANKPESIADTIKISQYVSDAIQIAELVKQKHQAKKLVLVSHSWGTVIGLKAALARPDLFYAYVGIGQMINAQTNEKVSVQYGLDQAKKHKNAEAIKELESISPYPGTSPITRERIVIARKWPQFYGGLSAYRSDSRYYFAAPWLSPEYEGADVKSVDQGNIFTLEKILPEFLRVDFTSVKEFPIPIFMFLGRHDYTTPSQPTADWLTDVRAPQKEVVWFENSAHLIPFEEPGKTLLSLVTLVRPLTQ